MSQIADLMRDLQPYIVITFGPDGLTSHHDHMHVALARSDVDRFYASLRDGGYEYGAEGNLFDIIGVPVRDEKIAKDLLEDLEETLGGGR